MPKHPKIYLIGMPASGKSTLGKALARVSGWGFMDLDKVIEEKKGLSVSEIFALEGEAGFREAEKEALQSAFQPNTIIATGGGTPCFFDNMDYILQNGFAVFLDVRITTLAQRALAQGGRPLLLAGDESTEQKIHALFEKRQAFYRRANMTLPDAENLPVDLIWEKISSSLK